MKCPICKQDVPPGGPDFPFCCERCRIADLANWATGKYVISSPIQAENEADEPDE